MQHIVLSLLVIAFASANINRYGKYSDTKQILAEIDQDPFGNVILTALQAHIQAKSPTDEINMLLNEIISGILEDQHDHDYVNRTDQAACDRILLDLDANVNYHQTQIVSNTQLRDDSTEALEIAEKEVRETMADIQQNENIYAREEATRNEQHEVWERKDGEHEEAMEAVDEATKLIQHLSLGTSFAQVKSKLDVVQKKLKQNTAHSSMFKPLISALSELSTNVNQKALQQIAQLLSELRQQLVEARNVLLEQEERQAANWAQMAAHLTNEHTRLVDRKQQLENAISQAHKNIETAIEFLEIHTVEMENNQEGLVHQQAWCDQQSYIYETQTLERNRQQDIIQRVQEHLIEKLSSTAQFVAGRKY